jgi:multiple sugar transport system permease protein
MVTKKSTSYLLLLPAMAIIGMVVLAPLGYCAWLSLHRYSLWEPGRQFAGLENYATLFGDRRFLVSACRTAGFVMVSVALELVSGLGLALMMHRKSRIRGLLRAAVMVPWAIPTVVSGLTWGWMFNDRMGVLNKLGGLISSGWGQLAWLASPNLAWLALTVAEVWKTSPFVALIILAGLQMIPEELYQAAEIDGAGVLRKFVGITLPLLWPTITVAVLFRTIDALRVFDLVMVMTSGGPGGATEVLSLYNYKLLFSHLNFGYGSAVSMALFLMVMAVSLLYVKHAVEQ